VWSCPGQDRDALERLASYWRERQREADVRVRRYLAKGKYDRLLADLTAFGRGDAGEAVSEIEMMPLKTAYLAPVLIYQKLGLVRALGDRLGDLQPERLHALRIGCKELRYTLEFFEAVLGPDTRAAIKQVVAIQDHLGALQDAVVASDILRQFLATGTWGKGASGESLPGASAPNPAVEAYLAARQAEIRHLVETFPQLWQQITHSDFSQITVRSVSKIDLDLRLAALLRQSHQSRSS